MRTIEDMKNELLSPQDVRDILKIQPQTLTNWIYQKKIPIVKMGRLVRFRRTDIENFLKMLDKKKTGHNV
jgi:excisionase family DNA binding protein